MHTAWKVPTQRSLATSPPSRSPRRVFISPAALLVKVTARMRYGGTRCTATRLAMR